MQQNTMRNIPRFVLPGLAALLLISFAPREAAANDAPRPNIVFLLCDDLGYGDVGCFGQKKIRTPNVDRLAAEGMRLTVHYSGNAVCAPSRCTLMTGKHPGHAFIRTNRNYRPDSEGQWPVPADEVMLPKILKSLGYATGAFGKWGLGAPDSTGEPLRQGIDRFFGYNCQGVAHNFYPTSLWDNANRRPLNNPPFAVNQKLPADADPNDPESYKGFTGKEYAPDLINEQARQFLRDHKDEPFLLYYPTTVPHLALQVPEDSLNEYIGKFPDEPYIGGRGYLPQRTPRAAYAAMVTRLDREIGRLIDLVEELGLTERTIFVFSSDNGPLFERYGGTDTDFFGSAGQFRGRKGSLYEGGIRVPCIVRWKGHIAPGTESTRITGFEDWMPTLLELIGAKDRAPMDIDGISFAPTLFGKSEPPRPFLYREYPDDGGQQCVRVDNWKAVRQRLNPRPAAKLEPGPIELYDLARDPQESTDVAAENPEVVARLAKLLKAQHVKSDVFPIRALDEATP
jgi:arylsulfatase A-like enzyme